MWGGEREKYATIWTCLLMLYAVNRWLSVRFNLFSSCIIGLAAFVTILTPTVDAALAGFISVCIYCYDRRKCWRMCDTRRRADLVFRFCSW